MTISQTIAKLEALFTVCNTELFGGELPSPIITIQSTPKYYGHCSTKKIWKSEDESWYEINIGAEFLNRPKEDLTATLIHEMVHLYCQENEIRETSQNGRYHNTRFKNEAEARGLIIGYNSTIGHSPTKPGPRIDELLKKSKINLDIPFAREIGIKKTAVRRPQKVYTCPVCGQTVKSTSHLNLICGDCEEPMDEV